MSTRVCHRVSRPLDADVSIPGSKSLTNRALVAAALADGPSILSGALLADDVERMTESLGALGVAIAVDRADARIEIGGCGDFPVEEADLYCGNSGTTLRFLTAACVTAFGRYRLDGSARMRERPVGALVEALRGLGARIQFEGREGYPPLIVHARHLQGGQIRVDASESSQFVSGVLLAAPRASDDVLLEIAPPVVSAPYLDMTCRVMEDFGVGVIADRGGTGSGGKGAARYIVPAPQRYTGRSYEIEPDASNACYFLSAPAIAGGRVTVRGIGSRSVQGDARFTGVLERLGCQVAQTAESTTIVRDPGAGRLRALDVDLNDMPDQAQTLAVLALFADGRTTIRNVANLRLKETDRLAALACELRKLGAEVKEHPDGLTIVPPDNPVSAEIDTYDDHRMAMSFALAGLTIDGLAIRDPQCCSKTFPAFWAHWDAMMAGGSRER